MRELILITMLVLVCLVSSTPIDPKRWLINHPTNTDYQRARRDPQYVSGAKCFVKGHPPTPSPSLRKGEYLCGDKICKLKRGEVPKECNGLCQYPV